MKLRLATQFGVSYLPMLIVQKQHLIEQVAKEKGGPDITTEWSTLGSGSAMTDGLLSGSLDYAAAGVAPLVIGWSKAGGEIRGVAALSCAPMYFNTNRPGIRSVKDLTDNDRIALPAIKSSIQAVVLQIAAARAFGDDQYNRLDKLTVSLKHPDGTAALLAGQGEITGHITNEPFAQAELADPRVHTVFKSYDIVGGPHTHVALLTTATFRSKNPQAYAIVLEALNRAETLLNKDPATAAAIYAASGETKETPEQVQKRLQDPELIFDTTPKNVTKFSDFMARVGTIAKKPDSWKDLFFDDIYNKAGS